jgi:hypothetical protein
MNTPNSLNKRLRDGEWIMGAALLVAAALNSACGIVECETKFACAPDGDSSMAADSVGGDGVVGGDGGSAGGQGSDGRQDGPSEGAGGGDDDDGDGEGDDDTGGALGDGAVLCDVDQHVEANACVACPDGTTHEAGDDASGMDTFCMDACEAALGVPCDEFDEAYIKASNTGHGDGFGISLSLSGDTLAIGAREQVSAPIRNGGNAPYIDATYSGTVYVFQRTEGVWAQEAALKASNTETNDFFGVSVSLSGNTLAVGASGEDSASTGVGGDQADNSASGSGAVYVFKRTGSVWAQEAYLKASNSEAFDDFGFWASLSGDTLAIGARGEDSSATSVGGDQHDNSALDSGAVYVFTRTEGLWAQAAYLKASNSGGDAVNNSGDYFGHSVSLSDDTLAVGAHGEASAATGVGGDQDDNSASGSGAVYVFTRTEGVWAQAAYLKASNSEAYDYFGYSVSLSDDTLAIGAHSEASAATGVGGDQDDNSASVSGAVYVFTRTEGVWAQEAYLKASNTGAGDLFGSSVSLSGDTLAVGALYEDSAPTGVGGDQTDNNALDSGAVYLFTRTEGVWAQEANLKASNTGAGDSFGYPVSLSDDNLAIGAIGESSAAIGIDGDQTSDSASASGAVYVRKISP